MRLRRLGVGLWYPPLEGVPLLFDLGHCDFKDLARDGLQLVGLALGVVLLEPHVVLLIHIVLDTAKP